MTPNEMFNLKTCLIRKVRRSPESFCRLSSISAVWSNPKAREMLENASTQDVIEVFKRLDDTPSLALEIKGADANLAQSQIVLWKNDIAAAAWKGNSIFNKMSVAENFWAVDPQLWVCPPFMGFPSLLVFLSPSHQIRELKFFLFGQEDIKHNQTQLPFFDVFTLKENETLDDSSTASHLYAMLEFTHLPFVSTKIESGNRSTRRQAERENLPEPQFRIIHLRHPQKKETQDEGTGREFSCQWIVGGHWRKQWYPSEQKHKPVYILPYVKGPDDQPLKSSPEKLYKVVR